jgi:hypothetical protein
VRIGATDQVAVGIVGEAFDPGLVAAVRVRERLFDDAAERVGAMVNRAAERVDTAPEMPRQRVVVTPRLPPIVHFLDDAPDGNRPRRYALLSACQGQGNVGDLALSVPSGLNREPGASRLPTAFFRIEELREEIGD